MNESIKKYARYHLWAYKKLFTDLEALDDARYHSNAQLCFRSIHGTLNHLHLADINWYYRLQGQPVDPSIMSYWQGTDGYSQGDSQEDVPLYWEEYVKDRNELKLKVCEQAKLLIDIVEQFPDWRLNEIFSLTLGSGVKTSMPVIDVLLHVFNHGTHHRGQISAVFPKFGLNPPVLDYFYFCMTN